MRTLAKWVDKVQDNEKNGQSIYDLCFNPDGTQLIVAGGRHVLVYEPATGLLRHCLKGHKDKVHAVAYASNGEKFASGGADKTVIVWNSEKFEGILKYSHSDSVQCLSFNPLSHQLVSCAVSDFAFWRSSDQKSVQRHKISARINACCWTNDGQFLALALNNGLVSIRNKLGEEKGKIERPAPIWALTFLKDDQLCLTDWQQNLAFYSLTGKLSNKERNLGYNALKVNFCQKNDQILISGLNKCCQLYTKDGIKLGNVGEQRDSWIWCCQIDPTGNFVALGCEDGTVAFYQLIFNMVHGLHKERYAFRENMTDVIIQHLITEQKVRIKCRDLIKKIAIYTDKLAVQLPERMVIYELHSKDSADMHYRAKEKIQQKFDCSLLVVCSQHLVICQENSLQSLLFNGEKEKNWIFPSAIRYIKNIGGPSGKEGLLLGLKNGQIWQIHLDNLHPLLKQTINSSIRCLDLSKNRSKLATVDDTGLLQIFNNSVLSYQEENVNSVAFNSNFEEMLAYSGSNDNLSLKILDFPSHVQKLSGFVVGLSGSKVFCLNGAQMHTIELPLSAAMYQFLEKLQFKEAYQVACLGVTNSDWEELAQSALENLNLEIARLAFIKLQNFKYLELIQEISNNLQLNNRETILGDILATKGKFKEAARFYQKCGNEAKVLTMYTDLRMFDEAQEFLGNSDNTALIRQKADWAAKINEHKAAADMYISINDFNAAIEIYFKQNWSQHLVELSRRLDKNSAEILQLIADKLQQLNHKSAAIEIYKRLNDNLSVLKLLIEANEWQQAFNLVGNEPQLAAMVYVPYAQFLAENDQFFKAQKAFHKAGESREAFRVFQQLTANAVEELRFDDAGFYYWIISKQYLDLNLIKEFEFNQNLAEIYFAYEKIHKYLEEPFTSYMPEALFNISRFLLVKLSKFEPKNVSKFAILFTLAKQAAKLGANKLANQMYDKLRSLKIPKKFEEQLEIASVSARSKPYRDCEEVLPMCYRCSTYNQILINSCSNCGQNFVFSFVSFELLPLVEFEIEAGISDKEALRLIETPLEATNEENILEINEEIVKFSDRNLVLNKQNLLELDIETVLVCKWGSPLNYRFYKNVLPELRVKICDSCFRFFHSDDFELQLLQKGFCPFCRVNPDSLEAEAATDDLFLLN